MLVVKLEHAPRSTAARVEQALEVAGEIVHRVGDAAAQTLVARVPGEAAQALASRLSGMEGVRLAAAVDSPYVLSSCGAEARRSQVPIAPGLAVGGREFVVMAGPCAVESREQTLTIARAVQVCGARALRGGAFKPRTSRFSFQGLGEEGLEILAEARQKTGLPVVTELTEERDVGLFDRHVDLLQIGMRNALNYGLLREVGRLPTRRPVLLKRGAGSTLKEFLCAADYVLAEGNPNVILCLRGNVGFSGETRSSLNVAEVALLRRLTHLPIVVDPSHVAGDWRLVPATAAAALAAGADGLLVEVHHQPEQALSDGPQSLVPAVFHRMMHRLQALASALGRTLPGVKEPLPAGGPDAFEDLCLEAPPAERSGPTLCAVSRS